MFHGQKLDNGEQSCAVNGSGPRSSINTKLRVRCQKALDLFVDAFDCAHDLKRPLWDFALDLAALKSSGLSINDLRWLLCQDYIQHGRDVTQPSDAVRIVDPAGATRFDRRSCFIITDGGLHFARSQAACATPRVQAIPSPTTNGSSPSPAVPRWDRDRQELRLGSTIVKRYKSPACNQELILAAFEEEGWPVRVDDPLPPQAEQDPRRRLHDTINSLNRNQRAALIRFIGDGSGQGVRWELTSLPHD